jgi:hypothetical protein
LIFPVQLLGEQCPASAQALTECVGADAADESRFRRSEAFDPNQQQNFTIRSRQ